MIYSSHFPYSLEALLWGTGRQSPRGVQTSGITQPPMLAIAVERVAQALPAADRQRFITDLLPVIIHFHSWIYRERDPENTGLPYCLHSWESGLDDTPYWTEAMAGLPEPPLIWRWLGEFRPVKAEERATPQAVRQIISSLSIIKRHQYDSASLIHDSPLVIQDIVFDSILAAANESLERLAEAVNQPLSSELRAHFAPTRQALEDLWDDKTKQYYSRNVRTGRLIITPTITTFMPLFAGTASLARARQLRDLLMDQRTYQLIHPVPTVPANSPHFEAQRYWRGPVWINMNWFVVRGLERYGFSREAAQVREQTLKLVDRAGFHEYYHPLTGAGLGGHSFSWSAALTIDLLN